MSQITVIKFLPYFPPHKGGMESHVQERSKRWVEKGYGNVINITPSIGQEQIMSKTQSGNLNGIEYVYYKNKKIGYKQYGYTVLVYPAFELIPTFPFPKFWKRDFWAVMRLAKKFNADIVNTHTRFFLTSLLGGIFAKCNHIKRVHIEHGSDYVKVSAGWKNKIAYIYDKIVGVRIFKAADFIIPISDACKEFIEKKLLKRNIRGKNGKDAQVICRGLEISKELPISEDLHKKFPNKLILGFVGRLYKRKNVDSLIRAYYDIDSRIAEKIQIVIVGEGEDMERLKKMDKRNQIYFTGGKLSLDALSLQQQFDIHIHSSSPGGGLATTLLQAMSFGCMIIATPNEGAKEVIKNNYNGILVKDDSVGSIKQGILLGIEHLSNKENWAKINKHIIETQFDWEKNIKKYFLLYENLLHE